MDRPRHTPPEAPAFTAPSPEEFGNQLRSMVDPQTPAEIAAFNQSGERVAENARVLYGGLPPGPTGEVGGITLTGDQSEAQDTQIYDERAAVNASRERVKETERALRVKLRPAGSLTGRFTW